MAGQRSRTSVNRASDHAAAIIEVRRIFQQGQLRVSEAVANAV